MKYKHQIGNHNLEDYGIQIPRSAIAQNREVKQMEQKDKVVQLENTGEIELPKIDLTKYVGSKHLIAEVVEKEGFYGYYVEIKTAVIETLGEGKTEVKIQATKQIGLQEDNEGKIGWGAETKMGLFLKEMNVAHYNELVGKEVMVQLTPANKEGKKYLTF